MGTLLEDSLLDLLPLLNTKNDIEEDVRLFRAVEILGNVEYELNNQEIELAKHFISCLIEKYLKNDVLWAINRSASGGYQKTSLVEIGKKTDLLKITAQDYQGSIGFGVSIRKLSISPYIRPYLEEILTLVWADKYKEFNYFTYIDKHYKKPKIDIKRITFIIVLFPLFLLFYIRQRSRSSFPEEQRLLSFRLLSFIDFLSADSWNIANQAFQNSRYSVRPDIQEIIQAAGSRIIQVVGDSQGSLVFGDMDYNQKYKILGTKGQSENNVVDKLVDELLEESDAVSMRITNALIIAAQKNPYAVHRYVDVMTDQEKYRTAISEYGLIEGSLTNASKEALSAMLEEIVFEPNEKDKNNRSRQSVARELLSNLVGLEPAAEEYLIDVVGDSGNFRKSVAVLDTLRRLNKKLNVDVSSKMIEYCTRLLTDSQHLKGDVGEFEFFDPIPKDFIIKNAMTAIITAPIDIQYPLFHRLLSAILKWDTNEITNDLLKMGCNVSDARQIIDALHRGTLDDFESAISHSLKKINNRVYKDALEAIISDPESPPAIIFREIQYTEDPMLNIVFTFAENLTRIYQAQMLAPGVICEELLNQRRNVDWFSINPIVKEFLSYFGENHEKFQPFLQNWPCSEKYFAVQGDLRKAQGALQNINSSWENAQIEKQIEELLDYALSDDTVMRGNAQEALLNIKLTVSTAKYFLDILDREEDQTDSDNMSWNRVSISTLLWDAPVAGDRGTVEYLLSRCKSPMQKAKSDMFMLMDDLGDVTEFWVNTFIANSVLPSNYLLESDVEKMIGMANNEFISSYGRSGMVAAFWKIKDSKIALSQVPKLESISDSPINVIALAALLSLCRIVDNNEYVVDESLKTKVVSVLGQARKGKNFRQRARNMKHENFDLATNFEVFNINEFVYSELYKVYLRDLKG